MPHPLASAPTAIMSSSEQCTPQKRKPTTTYQKYKKINVGSLKSSGTAFISAVLRIWRKILDGKIQCKIKRYVKKLLHSIFFLGHIHEDRLHPSAFFEDRRVMDELESICPQPFKNYMRLPHQTPFSILLDLAVDICGHEEEDQIKIFILYFLKTLDLPCKIKGERNYTHYYTLEATVIAVCYNETPGDCTPVKYYGASLSCRGKTEKDIMIHFSCLKVWHDYVSYAVLSFRHDKPGNGIRFPNTVKCRAFYRNHQKNCYEDRRPCKHCGDLFSLSNSEMVRNDFPYGNCAETECLNKLIFKDQDVENNMNLGIYYTSEKLEGLREKAKEAFNDDIKKRTRLRLPLE